MRRHRYCSIRKKYRGERRLPGGGKVVFLLLLLLFLAVLLEGELKPVLKSLTENEARAAAVTAINRVVTEELNKENLGYDSLVRMERSSDGKIQAITTNTAAINGLRARVGDALQEALRNDHLSVGIPVGTLLKSEFFHGRGPEISLAVTLAGNIRTDFDSKFESAGINQTKHQIVMTIHTSIFSFLPGMSETTEVETRIAVAETIIVGEVPQTYAQLSPETAAGTLRQGERTALE